MNKYIFFFSLCCCCLTSCIKDEAPSKECDIESAWVEGAEYEKYFYQTTEMRKEKVSSAETDIVFFVRSLISLSKQIPLNFNYRRCHHRACQRLGAGLHEWPCRLHRHFRGRRVEAKVQRDVPGSTAARTDVQFRECGDKDGENHARRHQRDAYLL